MTVLNKQALREAVNAANIASWGKWESYKPHKGARGYEVKVGAKAVAQHCLKVDSAFIAAANPATVLALLDELEAKDKQIAELVAGRQNLQRVMGVYVHAYEEAKEQIAKDVEIKSRLCLESNSLFDRLRAAEKRIAELEARTVTLPPKEHDNGTDSQIDINAGFANRMWQKCYDAIRAAGIGVKGE